MKTFHRRKLSMICVTVFLLMALLVGRLVYLMVFCSEYYGKKADELHERERDIKAARGRILDATGRVLADNKAVCTISVIHSQLKKQEKERLIHVLSGELSLSEEEVRKKVEKVSSIERIKSNVDAKVGERIRKERFSGVKVDEDFKRFYPYHTLASSVLGFTGADNQGIVGLEVVYENELKGIDGKILTMTDARGVEIEQAGERRQEAVAGKDLILSLDYNIQTYAEQAAQKVCEEKQAERVSVIALNPQNGEIYAMANVPEYDLNTPFTLQNGLEKLGTKENKQELLNQMWRNDAINDTYEPGSIFKVITAAAALEKGVVSLNDTFQCPGYKMVEDRKIRCARTTGHGTETFVDGIKNSCNPVFIEVGQRIGVDDFFHYFDRFGLMEKTGIDLPGEASTIMHKKENVKAVELATISFGQSFQVTAIGLAATVASLINGGERITPHFGVKTVDQRGEVSVFTYPKTEQIVSKEVSATLRELLEKVVSEGGGNKAAIEEYRIGGKTATSQTLPRSAHQYIASFLGFAPADDPRVLVLMVIDHPQGTYYGGTIAAPVVKEIFETILPYLKIQKEKEK